MRTNKIFRLSVNFTMVDTYLSTKLLKALNMLVNRAATNLASSRQRN